MNEKNSQQLIDVFRTSPAIIAFAELIIKQLKESDSEKAFNDFLLSFNLQALQGKSFLIAREQGTLHMEGEQCAKAAARFKTCLTFPEPTNDEKMETLHLLIRCILVTGKLQELDEYMQH